MRLSTPITRREFFLRVFAIAAAAWVARHVRLHRWVPTWTLQAMLDAGIQIPPGDYRIRRTLFVRRDNTLISDVGLQCERGAGLHVMANNVTLRLMTIRQLGIPSNASMFHFISA